MNTLWQAFLASRGAVFEHGHVAHFGDPASEIRHSGRGAIVADLSHLGLIQFSGEDAETFLQGQLTNDVRLLNDSNSQWTAYCTPKGRMQAAFLLWENAEQSYLAQLPASLREPVQKRLTMFVLRSKVKVSDESDAWVRLGVAGPGASAAVNAIFGATPQTPHSRMQREHGNILCLHSDCYELVLHLEHAQATWDSLSATCMPSGCGRWDWHMIRAGIANITPQTKEEFVPQMANYELIDGVNFKKGCYPGQEIVARSQYLGKLKRRMYLARLSGPTVPAPGDLLYSADLPDQSCGMVVDAQPAPDGGFDLLAVIQTSSAQSEAIHWKTLDGPVLELQPLPYPIPD